jgi:hypothetical protein
MLCICYGALRETLPRIGYKLKKKCCPRCGGDASVLRTHTMPEIITAQAGGGYDSGARHLPVAGPRP